MHLCKVTIEKWLLEEAVLLKFHINESAKRRVEELTLSTVIGI